MPKQTSEETQAERISRLTQAVIGELSECTLQDALTVICGIGGHLVANMAQGQLSQVKRQSERLRDNMASAAYAKLTYNHEVACSVEETSSGEE